MASVYISYALGSAALAYVTRSLYSYSSSEPTSEKDNIDEMVSNMELSLDTKKKEESIPKDEVDVASEESINTILEDLYYCYACKEKKALNQFSKNQQKRKQQNMWKCKGCTGCKVCTDKVIRNP